MFRKIRENKEGVSLLEMLVAVSMFSITVISATQIFSMVVIGQRSAIAANNLQESMHYAFESIAKEIRGATISNNDCASLFSPPEMALNKVYNLSDNTEGDILYFKNADNICTAYYLDNGNMIVMRDGDIAPTTSSRIIISNLDFEVDDDLIGVFHSVQPKVTIRLDVEAEGKEINKQKMEMQTTISGRHYE